MKFYFLCLNILILLTYNTLLAQQSTGLFKFDTLTIDITQVEQRFVNKSLSLIAVRYNVDISKANILQAKQWYNPNLSYSQQFYDASSGKYFDNSKETGQVDLQLNQLVSLSGKYINTVKLSKLNSEKSQYAFDEVVRGLKFALYATFTDLLATQQKLRLFDSESKTLESLITASEQEFKLGAIAGNELIRLKAERQSLRNEKLSVENDLLDTQKNLRQFLNYPYTSYLVASELVTPSATLPPFEQVLSSAEKNRPDLLLANTEIKYQTQNLKLQKSTAIPDLNIGMEYDRRSSYVENYYGIGAGIDLPVFNRNQGNIKAARYQLEQAKALDTLQTNEVKNQVANSYITVLKIQSQLQQIDPKYNQSIEQLFNNAVTNYQKRNIGLLEFLDQIRTYKDAKFGIIDLNSNYFKSIQQLNYTVGSTILK